MRRVLIVAVGLGLVLTAAAPAAPPGAPVALISVDEVKPLLDRGAPIDMIDVRTRGEYDERHIRGARSIPLREIEQRAAEIPRAGLVVLY